MDEMKELDKDQQGLHADYSQMDPDDAFTGIPYDKGRLFLEWLERCVPQQAEKIRGRLEQSRGGRLNQSQFGTRMRGTGHYADHLSQTFRVFAKKFGLAQRAEPLNTALFTRPGQSLQMRLFE